MNVARARIVGRHEGAADDRIDPNDLEEIPGDERDRHRPAVDEQIHLGHRGVGVGEDLRLGAQPAQDVRNIPL